MSTSSVSDPTVCWAARLCGSDPARKTSPKLHPEAMGEGYQLEVPAPLFCKLCTQNEPPFKAVLILRNYLRGEYWQPVFRNALTLPGLNVVFGGCNGGDRCTADSHLGLMWAPKSAYLARKARNNGIWQIPGHTIVKADTVHTLLTLQAYFTARRCPTHTY